MRSLEKYCVIALLFFSSSLNAQQRSFTLTNLCTEPVWFGFAGGAQGSIKGPGTICNIDADCYQGSKCVQTGGIKQCFFVNPAPSDGNYKLATGQSKVVNIPIYNNGVDQIWSGVVTGRTNCGVNGCEKADCGNGDKGCIPSRGFMQPATQAEFTLAKDFVDFYDVEVINGYHMAISMTPQNAKAGPSAYNCGSPGSKYPRTNVGSCNWDLKPPAAEYNWVSNGGKACVSDADCTTSTAGQTCGLSFNPGQANLYQKTCGRRLGYLTADQVCGVSPNFGAPFNCQQKLPAPDNSLTSWNMYACVGTGSCYQNGAQSNCCGCADWGNEGIFMPPETEKCKNKNAFWNTNVKSGLLFLKKACPTAYTYPFDDMSSTFVCTNKGQNNNTQNVVNYEIKFCPQNEVKTSLLAEMLAQQNSPY